MTLSSVVSALRSALATEIIGPPLHAMEFSC